MDVPETFAIISAVAMMVDILVIVLSKIPEAKISAETVDVPLIVSDKIPVAEI